MTNHSHVEAQPNPPRELDCVFCFPTLLASLNLQPHRQRPGWTSFVALLAFQSFQLIIFSISPFPFSANRMGLPIWTFPS